MDAEAEALLSAAGHKAGSQEAGGAALAGLAL
jgi:hypothetical protein